MRIGRSTNEFTKESLYNHRQVTFAYIYMLLRFRYSTSAVKKIDIKASVTLLPFLQFYWSILLMVWYFNKGRNNQLS